MDKQLTQQILTGGAQLFTQLAKTLGSTAIHVYGVLVKQQIIEGAISIIQIVLVLAFSYFAGKRIYQWIRDYQEDQNIGGGYNWIIGIVAAVIGMVICLNVLDVLGGALNRIANPEYFALKVVLDAVRR